MIEVGKLYKTKSKDSILILRVGRTCEIVKVLNIARYENQNVLGYNKITKEFMMFNNDGSYYDNIGESDHDLILEENKIITIDGKDIKISDKSYEELKRSLLNE